MSRLILAAALLASTWAAAAVSACNSDTTEGCLAGPCTGGTGGTGGAGGATTTTTTKSGTGGAGAADACDPTPKTGDFPCEVFAIVHAKCNPCHTNPTANGAPFPLLTYEDTQEVYEPGKLRFQQMYDQIQPGAAPRMPLGGMLTDAEMATLGDWLAACAPPKAEGTGCECPGMGCN